MFEGRLIKCNERRMICLVVLFLLSGLPKSQGDYMMGGHIVNNKEESKVTPGLEHRSEEESLMESVVSSRTSNREEFDHDFDLELDLLADKSRLDAKHSSSSSSSSSSGDDFSSEDEGSRSEESETAPRYRVLPYAFNGGHPFSLEKDPITGQIDFEKAPPLKALEYDVESPVQTEETGSSSEDDMASGIIEKRQREDKTPLGPNEINPYSPSFHDFLNLPVRYTYEKYENTDKYPLISNSYANTKVQSGSNSYNTYNHKKYHEAIKPGVDIKTLYVQPSRKTFVQSATKSSQSKEATTSQSPRTTTTPATTTTTTTTTAAAASKKVKNGSSSTTTTTTEAPSTVTTNKHSYTRYPAVTTWKPQGKPNEGNIYNIYSDYEGTLPIERLQQGMTEKQSTTSTPPSRLNTEQAKPEEDKNEAEYEEGYEDDYDHILQIASRPDVAQVDNNNDSQDDYSSYSVMDFLGGGSKLDTKKQSSDAVTSVGATSTVESSNLSTGEATTGSTTTAATKEEASSTVSTRYKEEEDENRGTTPETPETEEKRVTSMPIDTISSNDNYRVTNPNYGNIGPMMSTIDNTISSVTSNNNVLYSQSRPSGSENYYARPSIPSGGIVVKSTSNVVVPPGQDTVSFVLGNRQSVGSVSDAGNEFYGTHSSPSSGLTGNRSPITFGKIGNSRPSVGSVDNYSSQMIVSAGIGVGPNPIGSYHQHPSGNANGYDHAVVTVGMPTVDVVNPGESGTTASANNNGDSATNNLDTLAQKWWASTSSSANSQQATSQGSQDSTNQQFGYRVVFPDEKAQTSGINGGAVNEKPSGTQRPIEEHVIVVHESEIGTGNTLHLDLSSQSSTSPPPGYYHYETTTQRLPGNAEDKLLPELSESLTPPAERPNILPSGIQGIQRPPSYNYYTHPPHSPGITRPNDYRDQRLPQRLPSPSPNSINAFKRRPTSSSIDANLPNILPQFRPNAKTSHGHNRGETIGTIPAGVIPPYGNTRIRRPPSHLTSHHHHHQRPPTSRRPVAGPPHLQRLNPPPPPPPPPPISSLRLPTPAALVSSPNLASANKQQDQSLLAGPNRLHKINLAVPPSLSIDERHHQNNEYTPNTQQIKSRLEDEALERFSAEPPARPPYFTKRTPSGEQLPDGMPRIATLQMIQQHGGAIDDEVIRPNLPPPYRFDNEKNSSNRGDGREPDSLRTNEENSTGTNADRRGDDDSKNAENSQPETEGTRGDYVDTADSPVYVVYPVKGALDIRPANNDENDQEDGSVVLGTYGSQRPLPPDTLLQDSNDESDIAAVTNSYNGASSSSMIKLAGSFPDSSGPQLASDFPYPLERPDPSMFTSQLREKPLLVPSDQQKNTNRGETETEMNEDGMKEDGNNDEEDDTIRDIDRDTNVNVIPYLQDHVPFTLKENAGAISATLHRLGSNPSIVAASSTPIAYVYTPTTRTPVRRHEDPYSRTNFERGPILLPSQQPSSSSSSAPSPQNFMAPFVASASAEAPSKNGWSVVMIPGQSSSEDSTSTDRRRHDTIVNENNDEETGSMNKNVTNDKATSGSNETKNKNETTSSETETSKMDPEADVQTEKAEFDVENFTPQLFGGFKPILKFPTEVDPIAGEKIDQDGGSMIERPRSRVV